MKTKEIKKEVLLKLGLSDERSISTIMLCDDLVDRILNEKPIWFNEALKKYEVSAAYIQKLINNGLISCFSNAGNNGSKKFLFENELLNYLPFHYHKSFIDVDNITDVIKIAINYLDIQERDKYMYLEYLKYGKRLDSIGSEFGITRERVRQIVERTKRKLNRYAKVFEEKEKLIEEVKVLEERKALLQEEIDLMLSKNVDKNIKNNLDILEVKIRDIHFSVRAYNCMKAVGIETVYDLTKFTSKDLLKFRNIGKKTYNEIIDFLESNNIKYRK